MTEQMTAFSVLQEASGHTGEDTRLILAGIRDRGFVLVPANHPGEMLRDGFLIPYGLTADALAENLRVPLIAVMDVLRGEPLTADMALRLAKAFSTTPEYWLNLQSDRDLRQAMDEMPDDINQIVQMSKR